MTGYIGQSKHSDNSVPEHVCVSLCVAENSRNAAAFCHMCVGNQGPTRTWKCTSALMEL